MIIMGIDGGLAHCGYCVLQRQRRGDKMSAIGCGLIMTKNADAKFFDDVRRRGEEMRADLDAAIESYAEILDRIGLEEMSFPRHAQSACKLMKSITIAETLAWKHSMPLEVIRKETVHKRLGLEGKVEKKDVRDAVLRRLGSIPGIEDFTSGRREHIYDAAAVAAAVALRGASTKS